MATALLVMRTEQRVRDQSDVIHNTHICPDAFTQVLPSCATKDETLDTTHTHSCVSVDWVLSSLSVSTWSSITPDRPAPVSCLFICLLSNRDGLHCNYTKSFPSFGLMSLSWCGHFSYGKWQRFLTKSLSFFFLGNYWFLLYLSFIVEIK